MNYSEILASLGLLIKENSAKSELKPIFSDTFLDEFNLSYVEAQTKYNNLSKETLLYVKRNTNLILKYSQSVENIEKSELKDKDSVTKQLKKDKKNYLNDITKSSKIYKQLNEDINISIIKKNNITKNAKLSREIEVENENDIISSKTSENIKNYNFYIGIFNDRVNEKYKKLHSSISKSQYDLIDSSSKYQKTLEEQNANIDKKIKDLNSNISNEELKLESEIKKIETELNHRISNIQANYNKIIEQNAAQYNIEINSVNIDLEKLKQEYKKKNQNINIEARKKLVSIDQKYDFDEKKLKQELQDKKYENHVKSTLDKDSLEQIQFKLSNKYITHTEKVSLKSKYKILYRKSQAEKKLREKAITNITHKFESITNKIMKEKKDVEAWRQYNINVKNIERDFKKQVLESSKEIKTKEKIQFDTIQKNNQAKEINNEKRIVNIAILKLKKDFDSYNAKIQIEINKLKIDHLKNRMNKEICDIAEKEIIKYNQNYDDLSEKYYLNQALYNIEKNKYLTEYNDIIINYELEKNRLKLDKNDKIDNLELERYTQIANETIAYNGNSNVNYENIINNFIKTSEIHSNHKTSLIEIKNFNSIAQLKYELQLARRQNDIELLTKHIEYIDYLINKFSHIFIKQLNLFKENFKEPSSSNNMYFSQICSHTILLIKTFFKEESKILNEHIRLDTGTKFQTIYSNANYEYNQKLTSYKSQIENFTNTNNNYRNAINTFNNYLQDLEYRRQKLLKTDKNNKKDLQEIKKQISDYQLKNEKNKQKIEFFNKEIANLKLKIDQLSKHFSQKIKIIKKKEIKESEDSRNTINKLDITCNYYSDLIKEINNEDFISYLTSYKKSSSKINKFDRKIKKKSNLLISNLSNIITTYSDDLNNSLENLRLSNYNSYKNNIQISNHLLERDLKSNRHDYLRLKHQFIDNLNNHNQKLLNINKNHNLAYHKAIAISSNNRQAIDNDFQAKHTQYFLKFKSCNKLISYSTVTYNKSVNHAKIKKEDIIEKYNSDAEISCKQNSKKFEQVIDRYKNELIMIPRLQNNEIYEINIENDNKNKQLDIKNKEINDISKQFKDDQKLKLEKLKISREKERRNESKKYRLSTTEIKNEFIKKEKNSKNLKYKE